MPPVFSGPAADHALTSCTISPSTGTIIILILQYTMPPVFAGPTTDLALTARTISASEALALGLVTQVEARHMG